MEIQSFGNVMLHVLVGLTMLVGWLGLLIVIIPGLVIIWAGALAYALATGFDTVAIVMLVIMTILMVGGSLIDNVLIGASAKQKGASWWAIAAAVVGAIIGTLVLPPIGGLLFAMIALFAVEYFRVKDFRKALDTTGSMALGCGWAVAVRLVIGAIMIGLWVLWAFIL